MIVVDVSRAKFVALRPVDVSTQPERSRSAGLCGAPASPRRARQRDSSVVGEGSGDFAVSLILGNAEKSLIGRRPRGCRCCR